MKISKSVIAIVVFLLPILATVLWFYSGFPKTSKTPIPDFPAINLPHPPVSTAVALPDPPKTASARVLIDLKHGNLIDLSEIDPLIRNIESQGGAIDVFDDIGNLATKLKSASAFLSMAPMSLYTVEDMRALTNFVERGGRLVVITDPTRNTLFTETNSSSMSGVDAANLLLEPFDLSFKDDYLYNMINNEGNYRNIIVTNIADHALMKDISQLVIYGGHSLNTNGTSLATTDDETLSSKNDQPGGLSIMKISSFGKGQVLAIGDLSLMTEQYVQSADNQIFVRNLAKFLTESNREKTLAEFPFLFDGKVVIQPTGEIKVDGELLAVISNLEKVISNSAGMLTISEDVSENVDRILLTTFESNKGTKDILDSLKIDLKPVLPASTETRKPNEATPQFEVTLTPTVNPVVLKTNVPSLEDQTPADSPEMIFIPGIGIVKTGNLGVIGLVRGNERTTLLIMANSPKKIQELLNQLSTESLTKCLIHDDLAACKISGTSIEPAG
jgi:hypothetical protein